ncbi:LysR family regulatory protein [Aspergillus luchuensis]|uniref:LysR family regulatory protein n=1 Tax=Aspergillus kawachii TaxID=1069201 RepID=A0A146EZS5_ASPKA|nr:LysR family regulatory protein [Aspergillus luchuensis]
MIDMPYQFKVEGMMATEKGVEETRRQYMSPGHLISLLYKQCFTHGL